MSLICATYCLQSTRRSHKSGFYLKHDVILILKKKITSVVLLPPEHEEKTATIVKSGLVCDFIHPENNFSEKGLNNSQQKREHMIDCCCSFQRNAESQSVNCIIVSVCRSK